MMNENIFGGWLRRLFLLVSVLGFGAVLSACGGSGAGAGGDGGGTSPSLAASIAVAASSGSIGSAATGGVTITAAVKDASNVALKNQPVTFSTTDAGSTLAVVTATTDATGLATATLSITDATNRAIVVNAKSGTVSGSVTVNVTGTSLTLSGPTAVAFNGSSTFVATLKNSASAVVGGASVSVTSAAGNVVSPATATTNASGQATFRVTATKSGPDTLTASAVGVSTSAGFTVSGNIISFSAPAESSEVLVNTAQTVTVSYLVSGVPQAGAGIQFSTTRGTLSTPTVSTDASGSATLTIQSATAGQSTIVATAPDGTSASQTFEFVSRVPAAMTLQASPTTIGVNADSTSTNNSTLLARVRDATGNPVKGVRVDFSAVSDPSNGRIAPAFSVTDSAGVASTSFIAGANSSGAGLVQLQSTIPSTSLVATANMTVARQALSVRIGTSNVIAIVDNGLNYTFPWSAVVADTAGNPIAGATITASYIPAGFRKGSYVAGSAKWAPNVTASCPTEDANGNGVLDTGEDTNLNTKLDPGNVANTFVSTGADYNIVASSPVTDSTGFAQITVKYSKQYASWTQVRLVATITAPIGSETVVSDAFWLPAETNDLNISSPPPGGVDSPFGAAAGCNNTN